MAKNPGLTAQKEKFAVAIAKGFNQSDALRKAYPRSVKWLDKSVHERASKLVRDPTVQARIAELREKSGMRNLVSVDRVLQERARLAFHDPRKFFREDGSLKAVHELDEDTAMALSGIEVVEAAGSVPIFTKKLKMADKDKSLTALEKHLGMYSDDESKNSPLNIVINLG